MRHPRDKKRTPAIRLGHHLRQVFQWLEVQVSEICFIEVTFRLCCSLELLEAPALPVVPAFELLDEVVPLISTVWPTWSLNLEVSPVSWYVLPEESVSV